MDNIAFKCDPWPRGCLQVYTGEGKGKITAAFGLALRAAGHGLKVYIGQFMKNYDYGERIAASWLGDLVQVEQFGSPVCIPWRETPDIEDVARAKRGLKKVEAVMLSGDYAIVILDEINVAVHFRLIAEEELLRIVERRPKDLELVCTGRYAPETLCVRADLVTEMRNVKHPFNETHLKARDGIER